MAVKLNLTDTAIKLIKKPIPERKFISNRLISESLATTTKSDSKKCGYRSAMNDEIRHDFETQRARKRTRLRGMDELHTTTRHSPDVQQIIQSANAVDSFDEDELRMNIKLKWEATSKIEKYEFSMVSGQSEVCCASAELFVKTFFLSF